MSRINFADLAAKRPDLSIVWINLSNWLTAHQHAFFDLRDLSRDLASQVRAEPLAEALGVMVDQGLIKRVYKVESSDGMLVGPDFESIDRIPDHVPGRFGEFIDTAEGDVITGFRVSNARGRH